MSVRLFHAFCDVIFDCPSNAVPIVRLVLGKWFQFFGIPVRSNLANLGKNKTPFDPRWFFFVMFLSPPALAAWRLAETTGKNKHGRQETTKKHLYHYKAFGRWFEGPVRVYCRSPGRSMVRPAGVHIVWKPRKVCYKAPRRSIIRPLGVDFRAPWEFVIKPRGGPLRGPWVLIFEAPRGSVIMPWGGFL